MPGSICEAVIATAPLNWSTVFSDPVKAGQLFANAGLFLGGIAAVSTLILIGLRTYNSQVDQQFRDVFSDFWDNEKVAKGRDLVSYNSEYDKISRTLRRMADGELSDQFIYSVEDRQMMEAINCFCACLSRVDFLGATPMSTRRHKMFENMFGYWVAEVQRRPELKDYFNRYWTAPIGLKKVTVPIPSKNLLAEMRKS